MIADIPAWISVLFLICWLLCLIFFYYANSQPRQLLTFLIAWSLVHSALAYAGFYLELDAMPPRFGLVLIPSLILLIYGLLPKQIKWLRPRRNMSISTYLHSIRFPIELVLYALNLHHYVPELLTFEGRNYDIFIGAIAPMVGYLYYKKKLPLLLLFLWNFIGLIFVLSVFVQGILSAELPFQQFAFDQPNKAVQYFPFILLPATIVPVVIWTQLTDLILLFSQLKFLKTN